MSMLEDRHWKAAVKLCEEFKVYSTIDGEWNTDLEPPRYILYRYNWQPEDAEQAEAMATRLICLLGKPDKAEKKRYGDRDYIKLRLYYEKSVDHTEFDLYGFADKEMKLTDPIKAFGGTLGEILFGNKEVDDDSEEK